MRPQGTVDDAMLGCLIVDHAEGGVEVLHQPILTEDLRGMKRTPTWMSQEVSKWFVSGL